MIPMYSQSPEPRPFRESILTLSCLSPVSPPVFSNMLCSGLSQGLCSCSLCYLEHQVTFSSPVSLGSSWLWASQTLFLMVLTVFRSTHLVFCRRYLSLSSSDIFSHGFSGTPQEIHRGDMSFSSHHIKGTCYQHDFSLMMLTWYLPDVATVKWHLPPIVTYSLQASG